MTIKMNWGWRIGIVYVGFVVLILVLVVGANRQHFDLVTKDYYGEEIMYQKVIDAGKNEAGLSSPVVVHANEKDVIVDFPDNFKGKTMRGDVHFYSPVDSKWDRNFKINTTDNAVIFSRSKLENTRYVAKISFESDGKKYYQESEIYLHP